MSRAPRPLVLADWFGPNATVRLMCGSTSGSSRRSATFDSWVVDGYYPMNTPRLRPRGCLYHALQQLLHRLVELSSQRPASTAMHCSSVGQATAVWCSRLWAHSVLELRHRRGGLALSRKRVSEEVGLVLRIQHPSVLAGLERRYAANLGFAFHNFLCLLPPQLGSRPKTTHFLGGTSGVVVISRRKPCAARESRFLLERCPLCCPLGVNKGHGTIIQPRMGNLRDRRVVSGIHDLAARRMVSLRPQRT